MDLNLLILGFAILSVILGFVALLSQKIYLDQHTQKATEIKVPIFGKMKSNYPSLIFVFLGFALIFYLLYQQSTIEPVAWKISGSFISSNPETKWSPSKLSVFPCELDIYIDRDTGKFDIDLKIKKELTFEDMFEGITYTDQYESVTIIPRMELEKYERDGTGLLKTKTPRMRLYKPIQLENFQED